MREPLELAIVVLGVLGWVKFALEVRRRKALERHYLRAQQNAALLVRTLQSPSGLSMLGMGLGSPSVLARINADALTGQQRYKP